MIPACELVLDVITTALYQILCAYVCINIYIRILNCTPEYIHPYTYSSVYMYENILIYIHINIYEYYTTEYTNKTT